MLTRLSKLLLVSCVFLAALAQSVGAEVLHFTGDASGHTDEFQMNSPWLLDWSARVPSKLQCNYEPGTKDGTPGLPCNLELRLYDVAAGKFVGTIAQFEGEGRGHKLFHEAGSYRIDVVSQHVTWELKVEPIAANQAARLEELTEKGPSLEDRSMVIARQVAEDSFVSWRPVDDATLLLFAEDETTGYQVTFSPPCPGLGKAKALSFVTAYTTDDKLYDSILLDNNTRCYFARVVPTVFD
jgi:hypothetical protein